MISSCILVEGHDLCFSELNGVEPIQHLVLQLCRMADLSLSIMENVAYFETYRKECIQAMSLLRRICDRGTWKTLNKE
jgi:hypothetical protein